MLSLFNRSKKPPQSYDFLATNAHLKTLLAQQVSPILEREGYQYDGSYQWIAPWRQHSRQIVKVRLLKGAGGEFAWGYCFDFIPILQNGCKGYHYQRTDKSADLQLFVWTRDLLSVAEIESRDYQFSLFGADLEDVERRLLGVFQRAKPLGDRWFRGSQGPKRLLAEAERQSQKQNYHWPAPDYIKAFLLSATGQSNRGLEELNAWFAGEHQVAGELQEKLCKKLEGCANIMTESV